MAEEMEAAPKRDPKNRVILLLVLLCLAAVAVAVWALCFRQTAQPLPPDHAGETDPNAVPYDDGSGGSSSTSGGSVRLHYEPKATVDLSTGQVTLSFANPPSSNQSLMLQLVVQDTILAESGLLQPGNALYTMELLPGMAERLSPGSYDASFLVSCYDSRSGEQAVLQTEALITLTVVEEAAS